MISSVTSGTGEIQTAPNAEQNNQWNNIVDPYDYNDGTDTEGSTPRTTITPLAVVPTSRKTVVPTARDKTPTVVPTTRPTAVPTTRGAGSRRGKQCIQKGWVQVLCKITIFLAFLL